MSKLKNSDGTVTKTTVSVLNDKINALTSSTYNKATHKIISRLIEKGGTKTIIEYDGNVKTVMSITGKTGTITVFKLNTATVTSPSAGFPSPTARMRMASAAGHGTSPPEKPNETSCAHTWQRRRRLGARPSKPSFRKHMRWAQVRSCQSNAQVASRACDVGFAIVALFDENHRQ